MVKKILIGIAIITVIIVLLLLRQPAQIIEDKPVAKETQLIEPPGRIVDPICLTKFQIKGDIFTLTGALLRDDISLCQYEQERKNECEDEFFFFKTIHTGADYCGSINDPDFRTICQKIRSDENDCSNLNDNSQIMCESAFGFTDRCQLLFEPDVISFCESLGMIRTALKNSDHDLCLGIPSKDYSRMCYRLLGGELRAEDIDIICTVTAN